MEWLAILNGAKAAFTFLRAHWKWALIGGLLLYVALLKGEVRHEKKLRHNAELSADMCAKGRAADRKSYVDGQTAVRLQHEAEKRADEALHEQIRKEHNDALQPQKDAGRQLTADYARLHPAHGAAEGSAGAKNLPVYSKPAEQPSGPDPAPLVAVSLDDLNRCSDAVVRLKNARDWALQLKTSEHPTGE